MINLSEDYLTDVEEHNLDLTRARKAKGDKVVGVYCAFTPKELIAAAGGIPVSLCGSSDEPIPAAEQHLPRNICPLVKSSYGFALTDTCPNFHFSDFLVADATCDGKKKMYELLGRMKPLHLLQLPQRADTESAFQYWLSEIRQLKTVLENWLAIEITDEKLLEAVKLYNRCRQVTSKIFELNKGGQTFLTGKEISTATDDGGFQVDLSSHITRMEKVIQWAKKRGGLEPRSRILLTGSPTTCKKVLNIIEETAYVTAMENCGGLKTVGQLVEEEGDRLEALARKYLNISCSCMSPNLGRYGLLEEIVKDYHIDGVIDLTWQACHTYNVESFSVGEFIRDRLGVPFLQIETDYSESDAGWIKVRVEAFLEML
ncbi:double-cubane-cluster-containing anaerobic reductase [Candidatus Contubernalis alkaliaceticus]|uniref:double-cubane-cluster-containing anaerobic reductase n=1 Tax=Candidatus Contubernalis alkaliaceticus TaxID=338645 RepID=UPI001F4C052E|nr:double-cubane-cluster-containing anaerobic reductase [Candidatus Contubernalis alkalaceticus]UNC90859.1 2-hydroxyacyl-CoA dehydratase [Candidatus Contubernalis alkalaceticus]